MTYPNSPTDAAPVVWGWPWHGMIEGTPGTDSAPSELILPSGARLECAGRAGDAHNTHLWDIGMPDPAVESENPDERWLSKAIIRSSYSGGTLKSAYAYQGVSFAESHPMYVAGTGTLPRRIDITPQSLSGRLRIALYVSQKFITEIYIDRASLRLPDVYYFNDRLNDFRVQLMDESRDGRSALYWVAPRRQFGATERLTLGRTLVEITITGDLEQGFGLTHRIVEPYSIQVESQRYPTADDRGNFVRVQWADSLDAGANVVTGWSADGPPAGYPYALVSWPQGTATEYTKTETPIWAWYNPDGSIEVIRCISEAESETTYSSADPGNSQQINGTSRLLVTLSSSAGKVTKELEVRLSSHAAETSPTSGSKTSTSTSYLYGEHISTATATERWDWTNLDSPSYGDPQVIDPHPILSATAYPAGMIVLSNNILATIQRAFSLNGSAPTHHWCGDALSPSGIDHGLHKFDTANPNGGAVGYFQTGSYNPITGEVVRNRPDKFCSWV